MIQQLAIAGYRSIRSIILKLGQLNVVTGANGCGKSNLYRSLRMLADAAHGELVRSLARDGGFSSVLWAGPEMITDDVEALSAPMKRKKPVSLRLGFTSHEYSYALDLGGPVPRKYLDPVAGMQLSTFRNDPVMKRECLWRGNRMLPSYLCADRRNEMLRCRNAEGAWREVGVPLSLQASMLTEYSAPFEGPELIVMREIIRSWRFYDSFRTDPDAPARRVNVGTWTPVLANDGSDLAAALQTIREMGNGGPLVEAIDDAFPGSLLNITNTHVGLQLTLEQPGMMRELTAAELSDGTLRYLLLVAALLTPQPPKLLVLNEPEMSLHPDLIPALARLIISAAGQSQVIVVTHSEKLAEHLAEWDLCRRIPLEKRSGETILQGGDLLDQVGWKWPSR